jgi:hypothetical protein
MRMAERSAEERIELWYQQQAQARRMTQLDWWIHVTSRGLSMTPPEYVEHATTFVARMQARHPDLAANPAEVVQDRLDASAERARAMIQHTAARAREAEQARWAALTPEAQRREEAERSAEDAMGRMGDPEYLGQQAAERFYAEQEPNSQCAFR